MRRQNRSEMMGLVQAAASDRKWSLRCVRPDLRSVRPPEAIAGSFTSARAIATRCCSPPESSRARCAARSPSPTSASHSPAARSACPGALPPASARHRHIFRRRKIRQQMVPLPDKTDGLGCDIPPAPPLEAIPANSRRSILHRLSECPARPANAAKCSFPLPTARRSRSSRRAPPKDRSRPGARFPVSRSRKFAKAFGAQNLTQVATPPAFESSVSTIVAAFFRMMPLVLFTR